MGFLNLILKKINISQEYEVTQCLSEDEQSYKNRHSVKESFDM